MKRIEVVEVLSLLGGAADHAQLMEHGCTRAAVRGAVDDGLVVVVARGRFALPLAVDPAGRRSS